MSYWSNHQTTIMETHLDMTTRIVTDPEGTTPSRSSAVIQTQRESDQSFELFYMTDSKYVHEHYDAVTQTFIVLSVREITKEEKEAIRFSHV